MPVVAFAVSETTPFAVGATVFAPVVPGTFTKKSELLISEDAIVANAGAPDVVALKYCPVVPLVTDAKVSAAEV